MIILLFIIGICFGSFYGCMGYRIPNKINTIKPSSYCTTCGKTLKWYMNIPILSYILLKGKCAYCKSKIGISYFLVELFTGILFSIGYILFGFTFDYFIFIIITSVLSVTLISDIKYYYISDRVIIIGIISELILYLIYLNNDEILTHLIGLLSMFILMYIIKLLGDKMFKKESLGGGDIKLMAFIGLSLGTINSLFSIFISSLLGLIYSLIIMKKNEEGIIPFGPFLLIGCLITYVLINYVGLTLI